jgi:hypothetical protein
MAKMTCHWRRRGKKSREREHATHFRIQDRVQWSQICDAMTVEGWGRVWTNKSLRFTHVAFESPPAGAIRDAWRTGRQVRPGGLQDAFEISDAAKSLSLHMAA